MTFKIVILQICKFLRREKLYVFFDNNNKINLIKCIYAICSYVRTNNKCAYFKKFVVYPFVVLFMSLLSKPSRLFEKQCLCLRILLFICTQATFYCFSIVVYCSIATSYSHQMSPYCFVILFREQI